VDRPTRDDEAARIEWWEQQLLVSNDTREQVARAAAVSLALRDKRIADLERIATSAQQEADRKPGCPLCGSLTCRGNCWK